MRCFVVCCVAAAGLAGCASMPPFDAPVTTAGGPTVADVIAKLAVPERIMIVKDLPLTTVGKIDKKVLRERYQRQEAA